MATEAGELVVKISADVSDIKQSLSDMQDKLGGLGADTVAVGSLMANAFQEIGTQALKFAKDSIQAFGDQEQSLLKLTNLVGTDAANSFNDLAEQLQKTTTFSNNEILALESQLSMMSLTTDQVKQAIGPLMDYAAATGKDLPEAGSIMQRALAGNSRELKGLGVELFSTDDRTTKYTKTIDALNEKFGGMAEEMRGTTLGSIQGVSNAFQELEEAVGKFLSSSGVGVTQWLVEFIQHVTDSVKIITNFTQEIGGIGNMLKAVFLEALQEVTDMLLNFINRVSVLSPLLKLMHVDINSIKTAIDDKIESMQKDIQVTTQTATTTVTSEGKKIKAISDTQRALDQYLSSLNHSIQVAQVVADNMGQISELETQKKILDSKNALAELENDEFSITQITQIETEKRIEQARLNWEANASYSDQMKVKLEEDIDKSTADWVNMSTQMIDSFANATAKMIVEGGRFSDVMKKIWQQLAEAIIAQIVKMIAEWMVWMALTGGGGGGFGFMQEGGMINEPSMITGLRSGNVHIAGEAGPEMVVPTGGGGGGAMNVAMPTASQASIPGTTGGNVTVNISGQFLEGSQAKWQQLLRETIIPEIRRATMVLPSGPFNRVRGAN